MTSRPGLHLQEGGERPTARPARSARRTTRPAATCDQARQRDRRADDAADRDDDIDAYVKDVVDSLPPLTEEQRDLLALIFRSRHRKKLAPRMIVSPAGR
jgi:hypothetical protein